MKSVTALLLLGLVASAFSASSTTTGAPGSSTGAPATATTAAAGSSTGAPGSSTGAPGSSTGAPGSSTGSGGFTSTTDGGGTDGSTVDGDDFDVDAYCQDKPNGLYVYPPNCRKYVECETEPENLVLLCESDWLFNEVQLYCDFPDRVDCGDRPVCDENDENCEDHHITTPEPVNYCTEDEVDPSTWVDCEDPANEGTSFPAEPCGPIFCTCSNGDAIENSCQNGLIWNPDTGCDRCETNPACDGDDDCA